MSKEHFRYIEQNRDGISITLALPANTEDSENTIAEIKHILSHILKEYPASTCHMTKGGGVL